MQNYQPKIALLIDADNVSSRNAEVILQQIQHTGKILVKKAYGNWSKNHLKSWLNACTEHGITAVQVTDANSGKNASDIKIVIDAMEIVHEKPVDIFVLVTSDSDFTSLATYLVEKDKTVIGFGNPNAPKSLTNAFSEFRYLLVETVETTVSQAPAPQPQPQKTGKKIIGAKNKQIIIEFIEKIIQEKGNNGQLAIATLGTELRQHPTIDMGKYGYTKVTEFLQAFDEFDVFMEDNTQFIKVVAPTRQPAPETVITALDETALINAISQAVVLHQDTEGWTGINLISQHLQSHHGLATNFSYARLIEMIKKLPYFSIKQIDKLYYVKDTRMADEASEPAPTVKSEPTAPVEKVAPIDLLNNDDLVSTLFAIIDEVQENGWASMANIGRVLSERGYSPKQFGYKNTAELLKAMDIVELKLIDNVNHAKAITKTKTQPTVETVDEPMVENVDNVENVDDGENTETDVDDITQALIDALSEAENDEIDIDEDEIDISESVDEVETVKVETVAESENSETVETVEVETVTESENSETVEIAETETVVESENNETVETAEVENVAESENNETVEIVEVETVAETENNETVETAEVENIVESENNETVETAEFENVVESENNETVETSEVENVVESENSETVKTAETETSALDIVDCIAQAITQTQNSDGWATIGDIGRFMREHFGIKSSELGYHNIGELIAILPDFEMKKEGRYTLATIANA